MHAAFASWKSEEEVELNVKDWENYTGLKVVGIDSADVDRWYMGRWMMLKVLAEYQGHKSLFHESQGSWVPGNCGVEIHAERAKGTSEYTDENT